MNVRYKDKPIVDTGRRVWRRGYEVNQSIRYYGTQGLWLVIHVLLANGRARCPSLIRVMLFVRGQHNHGGCFLFFYLPTNNLLVSPYLYHKPYTYIVITYFPIYLPIHEIYFLQNWLSRWNQKLTQLGFIHNWVKMGIQWMVRWWVLVHFGRQ